MPTKRKLDFFDPNKSDSDDENFEPASEDRPHKTTKRSKTSSKSRSKKKRGGGGGYRGSDIDDEVSDSLLEESFSEEEEEEDDDDDDDGPSGGRRRRKAARKQISYQEESESEEESASSSEDSNEEAEEVQASPKKRSHVVTLKVPPSAIRARGQSVKIEEPDPSAPSIPRRVTRAHSEEAPDLYSLTNSGRHAQVVRASGSPEVISRARATRGGKGPKEQVSVIAEESAEHEDTEEATQELDEPIAEAQEPATVRDEDNNMAIDEEQDYVADPPVADADDDDDDDEPVARKTRNRANRPVVEEEEATTPRRSTRSTRLTKRSQEISSDFEPQESGDESASEKAVGDDDDDESTPVGRGRNATRGKSKSSRTSRRRGSDDDDEDELDHEELAEELHDLQSDRRRRRRPAADLVSERTSRVRKPVDYSIRPLDQIYAADMEAEEEATATPSRGGGRRRAGASHAWERPLYTTYGPFGGAGGPTPLIGGPWGTGATGGVESDSSDDENMARPSNVGGNVGMTPTAAVGGLLPGLQAHNNDPTSTGPGNLGRIKSQKALADADPLGVDQNVDFSKVGGLQGHIDQLKEMVQMPLLYPELFMKFHITPPRGVLFHGPPGTGKTLLARALAAQVGTGGRKITFYMRKGADALSKWVGEAERQLRLLFEEARKTQPSIIFFDEIDGLAPVRSSKQEQIHASIVSTLLALMDGMDGRGQVIVIGATNRPDNIDPALRRPGRFDREFYFPLPDTEARRSIINIHTRDWGIDDNFKDSLAQVTKGYGGADLRALCTEAALNSIQRTYPQIYSSNEKLIVDPSKIKVTAKDFMLSVKKIIPSSQRATSSGAAPLPKNVEPLLRDQLKQIETLIDGLVPLKKKTTALEEALYEQYEDDDHGFGRENLLQEFEKSRVFRPRLLITGEQGMGQSYIGAALLNHFEGLHVQNFDLPTIYSDSARSAEAAIVQLFAEVKRHKPSVIYLPGIDTWYHTVSEPVITTFLGLLRGIPPTDPVLVLGITDSTPDKLNPDLLRDLFGFSRKNRFMITRPSQTHREEFFRNVISYVRKSPRDFPEPLNRKKRKLEQLEVAPPPPPKQPSKEEIRALKKRDHQFLNMLKVNLQPIMDQINRKYKKFRTPVIPQSQIQYLLDEQAPDYVPPDVPQFRPFEVDKDRDGITGLRETSSGKFFYNLETTTIEERLSNGFYARPKDFLADIRSLAKDAKNIGDRDRMIKANELLANVEVDVSVIEQQPGMADAENVYQRQISRAKEREERYQKTRSEDGLAMLAPADHPTAGHDIVADQQSSGPVMLGEPIPRNFPGSSGTGSLSNGHAVGNGESVPSHSHDEQGDTQMGGTQSSTNPSKQGTQMSQFSGFQVLGHDTSPSALANDASTTTSKKTSDPSQQTSGQWSTQATNGRTDSSQAYSAGDRVGEDGDLPDTQREVHEQADDQWPHSQAQGLARGTLVSGYSQTPSTQTSTQPPVPAFNTPTRNTRTDLSAILNDGQEFATPSSISSSQPREVILDDGYIARLQELLTTRTSGCSIEQLEQINRELMDTVWRLRGEYNRTLVATEVMKVFNEVISDIEDMQKVFAPSQEDGVLI